ncbi:chorismate--pyruvate lyase family protein [Marinobacter sp. X15-166B]|uniref:chorismate--pyruvate lyase family protein n=1 Tax=Marinobacter sp. X15-166B TaxID=1897620 RepID=UPI00085C1414|nr:chorismate lyase [Marinobacter sp. X15-166B]OEY65764.1 chorismate--pyruvate lyase [Marinobacter sp. X15-166B]
MPSRVSEGGPGLAIPRTDWYPSFAAAGLHGSLPYEVAHVWLQQTGSLTRALQQRCQQRLQVDVRAEGFALPRPDEARVLKIPPRQTAWIREVQLCGDGEPWVLARTVIPQASLTGSGRRLRHLGQKPLGSYLFSRREWRRGPILPGHCHPDHAAQPSYARRSCFQTRGHALLVAEYFLPALLKR